MISKRMSILAIVGCLMAAAVVPAAADVIPEEWVGVWQLNISLYACGSNDPIFSNADLDTICSGMVFEDPDPDGIPLTCTWNANATSYTSHCEGSGEVEPGCTESIVDDTAATRTGETYTSVATTTITYTGACDGYDDYCLRTEITGTRINNGATACSGTPNENSSWGALKSSYR